MLLKRRPHSVFQVFLNLINLGNFQVKFELMTCVMECGRGFWAPIAGWDGSVMRVGVSRAWGARWILRVAGGGWIVIAERLFKIETQYLNTNPNEGRCRGKSAVDFCSYPCTNSPEWAVTVLIAGDWGLVAVTGATTVGKTAVDVVTIGRDCNANTNPVQWSCAVIEK